VDKVIRQRLECLLHKKKQKSAVRLGKPIVKIIIGVAEAAAVRLGTVWI